MPEPHLRAADADRAAVADVLGGHMSAGRLTVDEYDERLTRAYAARTYGELDELTADLPPVAAAATPSSGAHPLRPASPSGSASHSRSGPAWGHRWAPGGCGSWGFGSGRAVWGQWLTTAVIVTTIWLAGSLAGGEWTYPWPIWVIGPWGAVLLARTMGDRARGHGPAHLDAGVRHPSREGARR